MLEHKIMQFFALFQIGYIAAPKNRICGLKNAKICIFWPFFGQFLLNKVNLVTVGFVAQIIKIVLKLQNS